MTETEAKKAAEIINTIWASRGVDYRARAEKLTFTKEQRKNLDPEGECYGIRSEYIIKLSNGERRCTAHSQAKASRMA